MKRIFCIAALALLASFNVAANTPTPQSTPATQSTSASQLTPAQQASRDATRDKLRTLLATAGTRKDVSVAFSQSTKNPYNFVGVMNTGLTNCDSLEIIVGVTTNETVGFRVYPHYKGAYVNVDKAKNGPGLMRKLLFLSDRNFLYWGADESGDIFSGYTFTLESGFPDEAMLVVLRSIRNTDGFVGEMRPFIEGATAP